MLPLNLDGMSHKGKSIWRRVDDLPPKNWSKVNER